MTAFACSTILVPYISRLAVVVGGIDQPSERKVHFQSTPRLGGIAIFCSLLFTVIFFFKIDQQIKGILVGLIVIFLTGLADDLVTLTPIKKITGGFLAASLTVIIGNICVRHLGNPFGLGTIELGPLAIPFTIIGIVGLINAINLLDGMDGLAGGVCTIACVSFAVISYTSGNTALFALVVALLGALIGFLRYNNFPAKIFMGDSGSLLLGYLMGVFSVLLASGGKQPVSPYIPLIILGVPILDTLVVMIIRWRTGKRLFMADQTHIHHRLLDLGIGHKFTVLIVIGISYLLSLIAIFGRNLNDGVLLTLFIATSAAVYGTLFALASNLLSINLENYADKPRRSFTRHRLIVRLTMHLMTTIRYLLMSVLLLPVFLSRENTILYYVLICMVLLAAACIYLLGHTWRDTLIQCFIYSSGVIAVFVLENFGRGQFLFGFPLHHVSHILFLVLLACEGVIIMMQKRTSLLIVSPFDYLIMLIVLSAPLLPLTFTSKLHLLTVTAKSVIMFVGFKIILTRRIHSNRTFWR